MNSVSPGQFFALKLLPFFILLLLTITNEVLANGDSEVSVTKKPLFCPPLVCSCSEVDFSANCSNRGFLSMPPALPTTLRVLDLSYNDLETVNASEIIRLTQLESLDLRYKLPAQTGFCNYVKINSIQAMALHKFSAVNHQTLVFKKY